MSKRAVLMSMTARRGESGLRAVGCRARAALIVLGLEPVKRAESTNARQHNNDSRITLGVESVLTIGHVTMKQ